MRELLVKRGDILGDRLYFFVSSDIHMYLKIKGFRTYAKLHFFSKSILHHAFSTSFTTKNSYMYVYLRHCSLYCGELVVDNLHNLLQAFFSSSGAYGKSIYILG